MLFQIKQIQLEIWGLAYSKGKMQKTKTWKRKFIGPSRGDGKVRNRPCPRKSEGHLILDNVFAYFCAAALFIEMDLSIHLAWLITCIYAVDNFNYE